MLEIQKPVALVQSKDLPVGSPDALIADLLAQLAQELATLEARLRLFWERQQTASAGTPMPDLPIPRLFPNEVGDALGLNTPTSAALPSLHEAAQRPHTPMLRQLAHAFKLDAFALDALLLVLAPALDSRYGRIYGYMQDDLTLRLATVALALDVLGPPGLQRLRYLNHFSEQSPLVRHQLLHVEEASTPLVSRTLTPDPTLVAWLLGDYRPVPELAGYFLLSLPQRDETDVALTTDIWPDLTAALHGQNLACFYGEERMSQQAAVRRLAVEMQASLLTVDMLSLLHAGVRPAHALRLALRDACFTGSLLHLHNFDSVLVDGVLPITLLEPLVSFEGVVVTTGNARWQPQGLGREQAILWQPFLAPSYSQRRRLWHFFLQNIPTGHTLDIDALAGRFRLHGGQIRDVIAGARDQAQRDERSMLEEEDLNSAIRAHSQTQLGELTNRIIPRYTWQDLVLPAAQIGTLQAVVNMVQQRALVLEEWGVGRKLLPSPAVSVLFAGDPGTGKTMAAEVLAAQLGLDLYKIDLSSMVSKYIGETEKNLEAIFREAERSNAILFFDEADAVFGKRSGIRDAHDRYANIGVSYLLQRMEAHEGITILATNLRANLDEAFTRRLQFVIDFPFPEAAERLRIWQALLPPALPLAADVQLDQLANRFKLAGGNIRNIIVSAAFMAAEQKSDVTMELLQEAVRREFQKMGRLSSEGETRLPTPTLPTTTPLLRSAAPR